MGEKKTLQVGYLTGEFPRLSETFVLEEIKGHLENGIDVCVLSLAPVPATSPAQANLRGLPLSVINGFKTRRRTLRRVEKIVLALLELASQKPLRPMLFDRSIGTLGERLTSLRLARLFRRNPSLAALDLLHCHFGPMGRYAAILKQYGVFKGPVVTTFHAYELTSLIKHRGERFYDTLFRFGSLFLPISEFWVPKLVELGCERSRINVHRMGIDCEGILYRNGHPTPGPSVRLISTGRLIEKKGHSYTLEALALLRQRRPELSFTLDIVGDGPDEPMLKAEACRLGLDGLVRFHGGLPHQRTLDLLQQASIFVLPSVTAANGDMEGIPVAIMEAMAVGLPVISTFHSGIPELVEDGVSGRLVPERNAEALANAIASMLVEPETWSCYGRAGRKKIEQEFNRHVLSTHLADLYWSAIVGDDSRVAA